MTGTLGGSVTFHLKTSEELTQISWLKTFGVRPVLLATVHVGPPCHTSVIRSEFQGRLNVSGDCKNLQISNLYQNDSGTYNGQIADYDETFILKVYKNLTETDLAVQCRNDTFGDGNYTLQLNCSAGRWEDGVNYSWTSQSKNGKSSSQTVQIQDDDANYTCTADNPVSKASKTVSVQLACEGLVGVTVGSPSYLLIGATIAALIVVKVIASVLAVALASSKKRPQRR
ncbi:SLAM family member 5-like isoform X2 [Sphaerodactylus townsendi]|nr:SLAM family member 5-like isoform X2 [Sphaerodactylus townsendi]